MSSANYLCSPRHVVCKRSWRRSWSPISWL